MIASSLIALALLAQPAAGVSRPLTPAERAVIENAVREQLNDPDSATFRHNPYRTGSDKYCGRVNARNRFGGYVGFRLFSVRVSETDRGVSRITEVTRSPTILRTGDQFSGSEMEQLMFMLTDAGCSAAGYDTGYTPVRVGRSR